MARKGWLDLPDYRRRGAGSYGRMGVFRSGITGIDVGNVKFILIFVARLRRVARRVVMGMIRAPMRGTPMTDREKEDGQDNADQGRTFDSLSLEPSFASMCNLVEIGWGTNPDRLRRM